MAITNIAVSNFKSFKELDLDLGRLNVVIGANASGKSNFVEIFRFLKTLQRETLADAISLHHGRESILNKRVGAAEPLRMRVTSDGRVAPSEKTGVPVREIVYGFSLDLGNPQNGAIKDDCVRCRWLTSVGGEDIVVTFGVVVSEGRRRVEIDPPDLLQRLEQTREAGTVLSIRSLSQLIEARSGNGLLLHEGLLDLPGMLGFLGLSDSLLAGVGVYDVEPRKIKKPHEIAGRSQLAESGENLALVLKTILADREKSRKFHNLLGYVLPYAREVGVEPYLGTSLLLKLREEYHDESLLANLLSDGTVDVVALIVALFFEDKDVVIIEEPERNIHPHLISGLMTLMKDAARNKQIIITTHSPEVVRHAGVENLLLISRDKEGFSTVTRPAEKEQVKIFLKNDLGLDELFVQNALSI